MSLVRENIFRFPMGQYINFLSLFVSHAHIFSATCLSKSTITELTSNLISTFCITTYIKRCFQPTVYVVICTEFFSRTLSAQVVSFCVFNNPQKLCNTCMATIHSCLPIRRIQCSSPSA